MVPLPCHFNLAAYVLAQGAETPDKIALSVLGPYKAERWSYQKLIHAVRATGQGLLDAGIAPGEQLLIRLGNGVSFPLAYLGAIAVGIVPIPTSAQLTTPELDRMMPLIRPRAQVLGPDIAAPSAELETISADDLRAMAKGTRLAEFAEGDPERLAYIMFTSGTSAAPRAVAHAHRAIWARRMMFDGWYGLRADDRLLHAGALNWTFTLGTGLLDPWTMGATALVPLAGTEISALPLLLKRHDATLFAAAPGVLRKLLKAPDALDIPKLRHTLTAGEHLLPQTKEAWEEATGTGLYEAYGMTECSTFLSASPSGAPALTAQEGRKVALDEDGTILIHRDEQGLMLGYLDETGTARLPLDGAYFQTSDRASRDESGRFQFEGRVSDLLNASGYRVSPLEVEATLAEVSGIEDVAVAEIPLRETSFIAAFYMSASPISADILETHASANLARYKCPRAYVRVPDLPRCANGKLIRAALPDLFEAQT